MALDSNDNPHISYVDAPSPHIYLKYAVWNGSAWNIETVDSTGLVGWHPSLALDSNDNAHVSYRDGINRDLKYAFSTGVVPDFAAWLFLPFLTSATLLGLALRKILKKQINQKLEGCEKIGFYSRNKDCCGRKD